MRADWRLAYWGTKALIALMPADVVRLSQPDIDGRVLAFTLIVSMATSVLFGLIPAFHASKVDLLESLRQGSTRSVAGGGAIRTRGVLVVCEIALAVVLLAGAGVLMKSLVALHNVELGFQPSNVLVMKATGVRSRQENNAFFREMFSRIAALPGVVAVGATSIPPGDLSLAGIRQLLHRSDTGASEIARLNRAPSSRSWRPAHLRRSAFR